jgi:hypothetical protein
MSKYFLPLFFLYTFILSIAYSYDGTLTYEKFYRLNQPAYRSNSGDWIGLSYTGTKPIEKVDTYLSGDLRLYFQDNNSLNYSLQEAYGSYRAEKFKFSMGRMILDWNQNEKYWMLGLLNGNQAFTLLSDEEEGLTGILLQKSIDQFDFEFFMSYVFIPQVNPSTKFVNGQVESHSEWMRLPPKYTVVNGTTVPIFYKVKKIDYSKIVFNKSLGLNTKYNWRNGGLQAFAIYKPENKLRINAEAYYDNVTLNQVVVEADPTVNHHAYYGLQLFQEFGDVKFRGGLSYVDPNAKLGKDIPLFEINNSRKTFTSDYFTIAPRYDREAYSHVSANLYRHKYDISLNYIHLLSNNIRGADDFFSDAVKWKRCFGFAFTYYFNDAFNILVDLKYDTARFDNILKGELKYNYKKQIYLALGLEMLKAPTSDSYWSYYRANDTIYSSLGLYF